jgi:hypothetical protein
MVIPLTHVALILKAKKNKRKMIMSNSYLTKGTCDVFMGEIKMGVQRFEYTLQAENATRAEMNISEMLVEEGARNIEFVMTTRIGKEEDDDE